MSHHAAVLPTRRGGISLPDLKTELLGLNAKLTLRLSSTASVLLRAVGCALRGRITPSLITGRQPTNRIVLHATASDTGGAVLREDLASPRGETEEAAIADLLSTAGRGTSEHGWLVCSYGHVRSELQAILDSQQCHGTLNTNMLFAAPADRQGILLLPPQSTRAPSLRHISKAGDAIGDIVQLDWVDVGVLKFRCLQCTYPLTNRQAASLRFFCDVLVFNYPKLTLPSSPRDALLPSTPTLQRWRLQRDEHGVRLLWETTLSVTEDLGPVCCMADVVRAARTRLADPSLRLIRGCRPWRVCEPLSRPQALDNARSPYSGPVCMREAPTRSTVAIRGARANTPSCIERSRWFRGARSIGSRTAPALNGSCYIGLRGCGSTGGPAPRSTWLPALPSAAVPRRRHEPHHVGLPGRANGVECHGSVVAGA